MAKHGQWKDPSTGKRYLFDRRTGRWGEVPKSKRRWPIYVGGGVLGLTLIGAMASIAGGDPAPAASSSGRQVVPAVRHSTAASSPTVAKTAPVSSATAPKIAKFGPGTYEVGVDIPAGKYKTPGPEDPIGCYWSRRKDDTGEVTSIIANAILTGPGVVTVKRGEFFETNGCKPWVRA